MLGRFTLQFNVRTSIYDNESVDLCCYTIEEYQKIATIINQIEWQPINLTFQSVKCNQGGGTCLVCYANYLGLPSWLSIIVFLDDTSSAAMFTFVDKIEAQMTANGNTHVLPNFLIIEGIAVHSPRRTQEPFHR